MDVNQAAALARQLINEHGLIDWRFRFDHAKRRFGCCWPTRKLITLSRPLTELNELTEVRDTILHEIAHALVPGGHSPAWRRMCIQLGAIPRRCYAENSVKLPEIRRSHRYVAMCRCPIQHVLKRKPARAYICRRCRSRLAWAKEMLATATIA